MHLVADRLHKKFGAATAVAEVSFAAAPGEVLGLLGPNGAGKSTTISMLAGLMRPDGGSVHIDGIPLGTGADPTKRRLGLVTQEIALIDELPARMNLEFFGGLYGLAGRRMAGRIAAALELTSLGDRAGDAPKEFSGGMRRRLNIACALLHEPQILLLDEPTVGVDPQSRNAIFDTIELLAGEGRTDAAGSARDYGRSPRLHAHLQWKGGVTAGLRPRRPPGLPSRGVFGAGAISRLDGNIWNVFCAHAKVRTWPI